MIGAEKMSSIVNWDDRGTCVLFGDGAGSVLIKNNNANKDMLGNSTNSGYIDSALYTDGSLEKILYARNKEEGIVMNGREVFREATTKMHDAIMSVCKNNNISICEVNHFVIHQANQRILSFLADKLGVSIDKFPANIAHNANTSAASIPLLLNDYMHTFKKGELVVISAAGGGFTWGAALIRI